MTSSHLTCTFLAGSSGWLRACQILTDVDRYETPLIISTPWLKPRISKQHLDKTRHCHNVKQIPGFPTNHMSPIVSIICDDNRYVCCAGWQDKCLDCHSFVLTWFESCQKKKDCRLQLSSPIVKYFPRRRDIVFYLYEFDGNPEASKTALVWLTVF